MRAGATAQCHHLLHCQALQTIAMMVPPLTTGADTIMCLGGVQAIAAMAFGHFTGHPANGTALVPAVLMDSAVPIDPAVRLALIDSLPRLNEPEAM